MNSSTIQHSPLIQISKLIQENISLADKNWFKTGGNARYYSQPKNEQEFQQSLTFAQQNNLNIFILGKGANVLVSDEGFDGLVIHPQLKNISHSFINEKFAEVTAGTGVDFDDLIEYCLQHNLTNLEEFSGIPSTIGGAIYINLHYYEFFLAQFLLRATVIHKATNKIITVEANWFEFGYDTSKLHDKEFFLINATFKTNIGSSLDIAHARGRKKEIIRHRARRFPTINTCGSFFRNFLPEEVSNTDKKLIFVAYYLDKIGIKGELCIGDAIVSHQHANMLINRGKASSSDIIKLAQLMQKKVKKEFNIIPQPECQLIGFKKNPLL